MVVVAEFRPPPCSYTFGARLGSMLRTTGCRPYSDYFLTPEEQPQRMTADREAAKRKEESCRRFEDDRRAARRGAVRNVVQTAQRLNEVAPTALRVYYRAGYGKTAGLVRFIADVRANRLELDLDLDQRALFDVWADAAFDALAMGVEEQFLHSLLSRLSSASRALSNGLNRFVRAVSLQLRRLAHSIMRHGPPTEALAKRGASWATREVMTTA